MTTTRDQQAQSWLAQSWFGPQPAIGELSPETASGVVRAIGDSVTADELAAISSGPADTFSGGSDLIGKLFSRYIGTTHLCGFLADEGADTIVPVTMVKPEKALVGKPMKLTLDGLHAARYPGFGVHRMLFDFAVQAQTAESGSQIFHYNARFEARDGETVPVRNFPLFYGVVPSSDGITFGFQTVNVASSFDEGLLDFLQHDEFKKGLNLALAATPLLGQVSEIATGLTRWLAGQSANVKVHDFRQGLDFGTSRFGGCLATGTYIVVQIPLSWQSEWNWSDWVVDPQLLRLTSRSNPAQTLDFNHIAFGLHPMT